MVNWARKQKRNALHTLAHLGALEADAWNIRSSLAQAANELDSHPDDASANYQRALMVRHIVESTAL